MLGVDDTAERWRNALAELEYAQRHGFSADELEQLTKSVVEAREAMFQAEITRGRVLPAYLQVIVLP